MNNSEHPKHPVESWLRMSVFHLKYWEMCERAYASYLETIAKIDELDEEIDPSKTMEIESVASAYGIETIVFAGLCVESAIYDYAAVQLGDDYVREHFEKMDLISKWVVIPRLVCGRQVRKGAAAYSRLKKLVQSRNSLVHHKSWQFIPSSKEHIDKLNKESAKYEEYIHNAYRALVFLSLEMDDTVGPRFNPLPTFSEDFPSSRETPISLRQVVGECKHVYNRSKKRP